MPASSLLLTQGCILLLPVLHTKPEVWGCPPAHFPSFPGRLRPSPTRTRRAGARGSSTPSGCRWRKTKGTEGPGRAVPRALCQTLPSSPGCGFPQLQSFVTFFFPTYKALCPPSSCPQHLLPLSSRLMPPGLSTVPIPGRICPSHSHPIAAKGQPGEGALLLPQCAGGSFAGIQPWAWNPAQAQVKPLSFSAKKNVIFCLGWECCEPHSL